MKLDCLISIPLSFEFSFYFRQFRMADIMSEGAADDYKFEFVSYSVISVSFFYVLS